MILPTTYISTLLLSILTMLCWGSWANTYKLSKKWRYELFYFDYAIGVALAAVIAAFSFGSMGEGLTFADNFDIAGKRQMGYAFAGGVVFNLANILLVGAISLAGMAVAFPVGIGLALVIGVAVNFIIHPAGNPLFVFGGAFLVIAAIIVDAMAYATYAKAKGSQQKVGFKGLALSIGSGILMGLFYPLVQMSMESEIGLGPYSAGVFFAMGVLLSTFVFNLYFMNLPVHGTPVPVMAYFHGSGRNHLLGLIGGILWSVGAVSNFVAGSVTGPAQLGPAVSYGLGQGATMISAFWGVFVWKEFAGASPKVRNMLILMFVLFATGLALVSVAPLFDTVAQK
jgi:glucose uptake protein